MPLRTPILDDRSYAQLRDELVSRIPAFTPEWTDHHASDPGITLIELFSFLGENLLFRFNQIPDATRVAFLELLDIPVRPAVPASGLVQFETEVPAGVLVKQHRPLDASGVPFQTADEVHVWPVTSRLAIRRDIPLPQDEEAAEYLARTAAALDRSAEDVRTYQTVLATGDPGRPGGDVLDPADSVDGMLWVAVLGTPATNLAAMAGGLVSVGFVPAEEVPTMADAGACPGLGTAPPSPPMEWQLSTVELVADPPDPSVADPVWRTVEVEGDTTAGLTRPGVVRIRFPDAMDDVGVYVPADPDLIGSGDQAPLVEDEEVADKVVFWLRVFRPGGGTLPAAEWMGVNTAGAEQARSAGAEYLGTGTGEPDQERRLVNAGVLGDLELDVEEQGSKDRWTDWKLVDDFRGSGPHDRHFVLDREAGVVRFGDGKRGRAPQIGERIRVPGYRYGGGARGNVPAKAISAAPDDPNVKPSNPLPARGGADAETLESALDRIPGELRRRDRAVTASDFRELARETPGAGVARAECLPLFHPSTPTVEAPGVVSVMVWPAHDPRSPGAPRPGRSTLRQVCRWLDARRLVTTELYVIPPTYRRIAVSVGVVVKEGYGIEAVRRWVELVLRQYLAPLPPYGPEGGGWPLGRRVHGPELEAAALQVEGVEYLEGLELALEGADGWEPLTPPTVELEPWEVPELAAITVVNGPPLPPGTGVEPDVLDGPAAPVRAPKEIC